MQILSFTFQELMLLLLNCYNQISWNTVPGASFPLLETFTASRQLHLQEFYGTCIVLSNHPLESASAGFLSKIWPEPLQVGQVEADCILPRIVLVTASLDLAHYK
jgi:hypothetical protein